MSVTSENSSDKSLGRLIRQITASEGDEPDPDKLRELKKICKSHPETVQTVGESLLRSLTRSDHCQIRLQSFRVLDHLFRRSAGIRSAVVSKLTVIVSGAFGLDDEPPLPPPQNARETLMALSRRCLAEWNKEYKNTYPKLTSTVDYLKEQRSVDVHAEEHRRREAASKSARLWRDRCQSVVKEMEERISYMEEVCVQIQNAVDILVPSSEFIQLDSDSSETEHDDGRGNGVLNLNASVARVDLSIPSFLNADNEVLVCALREQMKVLSNKLLPMATKWATIFEKAGPYLTEEEEFGDQRDLAENVRDKLSGMEALCHRLNLPQERKRPLDSDDEDDDFEDVPEKEGFEETYGEPSIEPWKDRVELKKLEAATGQKLIFDKKRKRRLRPSKVTQSRDRLGKKLFNRSSLKRVREDMKCHLQSKRLERT